MHGTFEYFDTPVLAYADLSRQDLEYINRRATRIARALGNRYKALGHDREILKRFSIPKDKVEAGATPRLTLYFMREQINGDMENEAIVAMDFSVRKPRDPEILQMMGLESDPEADARRLEMTAAIVRPRLDNEFTVTANGTASTMSALIFDELKNAGLIKAEDNRYIPLDADTFEDAAVTVPERTPNRTEKLQAAKIPLAKLQREHARFIGLATVKFQENFIRRYNAIFDDIDFQTNTIDHTFSLRFKANREFAGKNPYIDLRGTFDLVWRNDGKFATALRLKLTNGLFTKKQAGLTQYFRAINILKRREASIDIFNILAEAGRINTNPVKEYYAVEKRRAWRVHPRERQAGHRTSRRDTHRDLAIKHRNKPAKPQTIIRAEADSLEPALTHVPMDAGLKARLQKDSIHFATMATSAHIASNRPS